MVSMEKNLASERRRYPRFSVDLPMKYTRTKLYSRYGKYGRVVNASEGGLLVHLPEEPEVGQQLALQLFFSSRSELNILETSVRVVWTTIHVRRDLGWDYRTGLSFMGSSPDNLTRFKDYLIGFAHQTRYTA
jgi:hypothetical protein